MLRGLADLPLNAGPGPVQLTTGTFTYTEHHWRCGRCNNTSVGFTEAMLVGAGGGAGFDSKYAARVALNKHRQACAPVPGRPKSTHSHLFCLRCGVDRQYVYPLGKYVGGHSSGCRFLTSDGRPRGLSSHLWSCARTGPGCPDGVGDDE